MYLKEQVISTSLVRAAIVSVVLIFSLFVSIISLYVWLRVYPDSAQEIWDHTRLDVVAYISPHNPRLLFAMGSYYMDSESGRTYDLDRAGSFLMKVLKLDPKLPYLQHQLARVAFLKGDFATLHALHLV